MSEARVAATKEGHLDAVQCRSVGLADTWTPASALPALDVTYFAGSVRGRGRGGSRGGSFQPDLDDPSNLSISIINERVCASNVSARKYVPAHCSQLSPHAVTHGQLGDCAGPHFIAVCHPELILWKRQFCMQRYYVHISTHSIV